MRNTIIPILERESGRRCGEGLLVAYNPEFLRESTAVADFFAPPKTVVGADDPSAALQVANLYDGIRAPLFTVSFSERDDQVCRQHMACAESLLRNEIGNICQVLNIDSHELMNVFCSDTKLNISPYYLKPGYALADRACRRMRVR
jgi:GDP-mannose 6-dehydrogenase